MPAGDGTGPAGMGPMTGRAAGYCAGYVMPGYANQIPGRGWGLGRGGGWGRRWRRWPGGFPGAMPSWGGYGMPPTYAVPPELDEAKALQAQAEHFEAALGNIRRRLEELEAARQKES